MALLFLCPTKDPVPWKAAFRAHAPSFPIYFHPEPHPPDEIEVALVWNHPPGNLDGYPNLKAVISLGAGVDHLLADPHLPNIPIARVVDPSLAQDMARYICSHVLRLVHQHGHYANAQQTASWKPLPALTAHESQVGIMGLGEMGRAAADALAHLAIPVHAWVRTERPGSPVPVFAGRDQLPAFLSATNILVCLLPLTPATQGIINLSLLDLLPQGSHLINAARGGHLVDGDLLAALASGRLASATLDVFHQEPLPSHHGFWHHPQILITPHVASLTNPITATPQIIENYQRAIDGQPLLHAVDLQAGY